jgi:hypothetical protein
VPVLRGSKCRLAEDCADGLHDEEAKLEVVAPAHSHEAAQVSVRNARGTSQMCA